jgi:hypothetical protein
MVTDFSPIKVTGCDESKVRKASGARERYMFAFALSAKPHRDWEDAFDDVWRASRKQSSTPKAQAYVRKGDIVIECGLSEITDAFPRLKSSVDLANLKYGEHLLQKAEKDEKKRRKREEEKIAEKSAIHDALAGLDFS